MSIDYKTYIQSPQWRVRSRLYRNAHPSCEICGCGDKFSLHTHHTSYDHIGDERDDELMTLCSECHKNIEEIKNYSPSTEPFLIAYSNSYRFDKEIFSNGGNLDNIRKALGIYAPIIDKMRERYLTSYRIMPGKEFEYYCRLKSACDKFKEYAAVIKEPEVNVETPWLITNSFDLYTELEPFAEHAYDGLNGKDSHITYASDSVYDFCEFVELACYWTENKDIIFVISCMLCAFWIEIHHFYSKRYPNLSHNARYMAKEIIKQIDLFFDNSQQYIDPRCNYDKMKVCDFPPIENNGDDDLPF